MYSRDYGGIRSDGTLYEMEHGFYEPREEPPAPAAQSEKGLFGGRLASLRDLKLDDLLLIAIGVLLLLDSDSDPDSAILLVLAMLLL